MIDDDAPNLGYVAPDLFMGLAAILVLILAVISTQEIAHESKAVTEPKVSELLSNISEPGRQVFILDQGGVNHRSSDGSVVRIPIDQILGTTFSQSDTLAPLLVVLDRAGETSFLLDVALAKSGVTEVSRIRVSGQCKSLEFVGMYAKCMPDGE